jgi:hypothetical protein
MKSFIPRVRCLILLTAIVALSIGTAFAGEFSINVLTACESKDGDIAPTTTFYAGQSRLKYFVQPDLYKNLADGSVSYTLPSDSGTELAFKEVHVEKGFIVLIVQAKAGAKASLVQFNITTK